MGAVLGQWLLVLAAVVLAALAVWVWLPLLLLVSLVLAAVVVAGLASGVSLSASPVQDPLGFVCSGVLVASLVCFLVGGSAAGWW